MGTTDANTKTKWAIDTANSQIGFTAKYLKFSNIRGVFKEFDATIYTMGGDLMSAEVDFRVNAASIDTGNEQRDAHLGSADFFDVEQFKEINFTADSFVDGFNEEKYTLYGNLTMKGIKKAIELDVEFGGIIRDPWGTDKAMFSIKGKINRRDWGLDWNKALEGGGVLVSEDVWINCEVLLIKQS